MLKRATILFLFLALSFPLMAWDKASALPERITQLELVPGSVDVLFAVTTSELFRSTDAGLTWSRPGVAGHVQLAVHPRNSKVYVLASSDVAGARKITLSLSRNFGQTFTVQRSFDPSGDLVPRKIFLDPFRGVRLYGIDSLGQPLVSLDDGKKWRSLRAPSNINFEQVFVSPLNSDAIYLSGRRIAGGNSVLYISHNLGKTWELLSSRSTACQLQQFYDDPFFARILVSTCEGTKTLASHGIKTSSKLPRVTSVVSVPGVFGSLFSLNERSNNSGSNLWISLNGGANWKAVDSLGGNITAVTVLNNAGKSVVIGMRDGSVFRRKLSSFN